MGRKSRLQLQHWRAPHRQMCHFSCLAEKLKWSFLPALNFMMCCSIIKKISYIAADRGWPRELALFCSSQAGTGSSAKTQEIHGAQPTRKWDILLREPSLPHGSSSAFFGDLLCLWLCSILISPEEGLPGFVTSKNVWPWLCCCCYSEKRNSISSHIYNWESTKCSVHFSSQSLSKAEKSESDRGAAFSPAFSWRQWCE